MENQQADSKMCMEVQRAKSNKDNLEKGNKVWVLMLPDFKTYYKSSLIKTSMVLAQ